MPYMIIRCIARKLSRAHFTESDTRAMIWVNIGSDFEYKSGELRFIRFHLTFFCLGRTGARSNFHKCIQQFLYTEVIQCRTEEYRSQLSFQITLYIKFGINTINKFKLITQFFCQRCSNPIVKLFGMNIYFHLFSHYLLGRLKEVKFLFINIIYAFEAGTTFNRPCQRTDTNGKFFFQLIQQIERIFSFTVHLIDKNNYRSLSHTANFHQLARLCFHTFCTIHHNNYTIHSRQSTISIFGKVLVSRSIENIDFIIMIIKLHHRSGNRDTTLLFNIHPVGCCSFLYFIALHGSCHLNLSTEKQQLLCQ